MSSTPDPMFVIVPERDIAALLALSMFRMIRAPLEYRTYNPKDRRTWPNPNSIKPNTWLYILGAGPDMPVHEAKAKKVFRIAGTESLSIAGTLWTTYYGLPLALNPGLAAFERVWSNSADASLEDWGLRFALLDATQVAAKEGLKKGLATADAYFARPGPTVLANCRSLYEAKVAAMSTTVAACPQYTIHVSDEVIKEFGLPKEWREFIVRFVNTTGVEVDTSLLAYRSRDVDILVQYRRHQLTNNVCHRYYCRATSDRVSTLLDWSILAGHPRAASGQVTGAKAPFSDPAAMAAIDNMPPLVEA